MILFISKLVRSMSTMEAKKIPKKCYAVYHFPYSKNDVCDCIDVCKYTPPPNNGFKEVFIENIQQKNIQIEL